MYGNPINNGDIFTISTGDRWISEASTVTFVQLVASTGGSQIRGQLINYAVTFVTLHVVGQEGTTAVASVGLALALYTCLGVMVKLWGVFENSPPWGNRDIP